MRTLKHLLPLMREFWGFAWQKKAWWIIPIITILLLFTALIAVGSGVTPFIYPLF
jgi:hypothetical protein